MTRSAWVVGAGGLLGSALARRLDSEGVDTRRARVDWADPARTSDDLVRGLRAWWADVSGTREIYWAAGSAVTSSEGSRLDAETEAFAAFVTELSRLAAGAPDGDVRFFYASSVGGVYSGSGRAPFDESRPTVASSPYGAAKIVQERLVHEAAAASGLRAFIGRITSLYGPGQRIDKPQGLITHLCRSYFTRTPLPIYVPLDTMRDYLHADDAAAIVEAGMTLLAGAKPGVVVKNIGCFQPVTIGGLLDAMRIVFKRRPLVVLGTSPLRAGQVTDLRVLSNVWPELDRLPRRQLVQGVAEARDVMSIAFRAPRAG